MKPALAIEEPDGSRAYLHPLTGERVPSVTTVLKCISKPALDGWAARTTARYASQHWDELDGMDPADRLETLKTAYEEESRPKRDKGTLVHEICDSWAKGTPSRIDKSVDSYMSQFFAFLGDVNPVYVETECTMWNRRHGYAGTADAIAMIEDHCTLIDIKGLALDTPLPTPSGWTTMGAVQVGDELFDSAGRPCRVTAKSGIHFKPCRRMRFDDGSEIICDHDHRWVTMTGVSRASQQLRESVVTADEIARTLRGSNGQRHHRVTLAGALHLDGVELPVHPYVLGCWLGDGNRSRGEISKPDEELFENIAACGYEVGPDIATEERCRTHTVYGLRAQLRAAGFLGSKTVPDIYLRASRGQRLALLQGLMDTDGTWNRRRQQAVFGYVTNKALAMAVRELALSLGQRATLFTSMVSGFGKQVEAYSVAFAPRFMNPFRLPRKAALAENRLLCPTAKGGRRIIHSAEPCVSVRTQCITVDSPDQTYLCGEAMIPTHNTGRGVYPEYGLQVSALSHCEFIVDADGNEWEMPEVTRHALLHLRPRSWRLVPVYEAEDCFSTFLAARRIWEWNTEIAPHVLGES